MRIIFSKNSWEDYISWQSENKKMLRKINELIKDIPEESINDISKIIYNDIMSLGNKTLETWLNEKTGAEYNQKKTLK